MKNRLAFTFIWISLWLPAIAQAGAQKAQSAKPKPSTEQITAEEVKQADELAKRFIQRFQETRDIGPLIDEMFTQNFKSEIEQNTDWSSMVGQGTSLTENLNAGQRLKCFIAGFNFQYLLRTYLLSQISFVSPDVSQSEELLPAKIRKFFKEKAPADEEIKSAKQAIKYLAFLEEAVALLQEEVRRNPPELTAQFKKNLEAFEAHLNQYVEEKPSVRVYKETRHGLLAGTRLIRVVIPFHVGLAMVKDGNVMKLEGAATNLPPD
jgi:hypothetical protein